MGLTLEIEQRLEAAGMVVFFDRDRPNWVAAARQAYEFVKANFPPTSTVRRDDVSKALKPIVEVREDLREHLAREKLRQKYWVDYFVDLIVDRSWDELMEDPDNAAA